MRRSPDAYAELHAHSAYSMLDGASMPERLIDRAVELGLRALALTDHDDLGGVPRFAEHARVEHDDFPAIIGLEATVQGLTPANPVHHLTLLARTREGYANLGRLVTEGRRTQTRGRPRITMDTLGRRSEGLLCLSGCPRGLLSSQLATGNQLGARRFAGQLHDLFGAHFAVEISDHGTPAEAKLAAGLIGLAQDLELPWVVTNNVHYATGRERLVHDVLTCLRHRVTLDTAGRRLRPNGEWRLKSPAEICHRWRHDLAGVRASVRLAERCTFRLKDMVPALPQVPLPPEFDDTSAWLRHLSYEGAEDRWGAQIGPQHRKQLERELALIHKKGLSDYFLIMWEIVAFARARKILVQGRGSAANSAVCYCLGITAVDPIRFSLLFERFLSEAREGYPDIDLDIAHVRREEVLQFVYSRYGRDRAAMVCEHIRFRGRSAVRDAARVLGFSPDEGGRIAEQLHRGDHLDAEMIAAAGFNPEHTRLEALLKVVTGLVGLPRHRSIHVGGFVLSANPIAEVVPIENASMEGRTIIQWDKDDLNVVGLAKFDLLGLGMLTALAEGLELVSHRHGVPATLYTLPQDPRVYEMIGAADTVGVFQIESRAQMNALPRTKPRTFYELAIQVALIRPGPLQGDMVHPYIRRKRGEEKIEYVHPSVEPILGRTLGVPLFQEQGMQLAVTVAGFSAVEADALRRAMGSQRHRHKLSALNARLMEGMLERGIAKAFAERVVKQIEGFSTYGFPESHSTSFALIVYASCWLKCLYPAEFLCAMLNAQPMGFYAPASLIHDAKRHGVRVRPPCLKRSLWRSRMEGDAVRVGLRLIDGLGNAARRQLESAVAQKPFESALDVARRTQLPMSALTVLAEAGAFAALVPGGRRDALWEVLRSRTFAQCELPLRPAQTTTHPFAPMTAMERTRADYKTMHLSCGRHPVSYARESLERLGAITALGIRHLTTGAWVRVGGIVNTRQRPPAAKGFFFLTLEDETGFLNVIVRPDDFEANRRALVSAAFLWVEGVVTHEQDVWNVKGRQFRVLELDDLRLPASRDFR